MENVNLFEKSNRLRIHPEAYFLLVLNKIFGGKPDGFPSKYDHPIKVLLKDTEKVE